jgi:hypothetical protein
MEVMNQQEGLRLLLYKTPPNSEFEKFEANAQSLPQ